MQGWSIARRFFLAYALFTVLLGTIVGGTLFVDTRDRGFDEAEARVLAVATTIADSPLVLAASATPDPSSVLQPYALQVSTDAGLDFITIMAPDRTRWTHPTTSELGRPYIGTIAPALAGHPFTEVNTGTLGPSVRAVVPVTDAGGSVRALVAVGVTTSNVSIALSARLPLVAGLTLVMLSLGLIFAGILSRYLRRVTLGLGPEQLSRLFVYYDSVLHSVREGLVLTDLTGKLVVYNDQAARLLGIPPAPVQVDNRGRSLPAVSELTLPASLAELLQSGRLAEDEIHVTDNRVLVVSQEPALVPALAGRSAARGKAQPMGVITTIRDHTDLQSLGTELATMHTLSTALRAQTHEHSNRLHTLISLMELGRTEDALEFATQDLELSQQLTDDMINSVDEPVISALIMGKTAQAHELGIVLHVDASGDLTGSALSVQDLVTVLGNLIDNALDAAANAPAPRRVDLLLRTTDREVIIEVTDTGFGVDMDARDEVLRLGYSTKPPGTLGRGLGLALVRQAVARLGGTLTIGRRVGAVFTVTIPVGSSQPFTDKP